ncbi:MAG: MerR family transcriptional regulator [Alphaproteobacteria bacterium]|tara:strand:- start:62 stop:391 length:330 start_codon:yes stop_codon:yes gene_type:complete
MDKKPDAYKTIGEVSKELNIPTHILRFWETKFEKLKLVKRKNKHRYYSKEDIIFILNIKKMVSEEGYTIKGVQKNLINNKNIVSFNNEEEYLRLINEIKIDINNIINSQ